MASGKIKLKLTLVAQIMIDLGNTASKLQYLNKKIVTL